MAVLLNLVRYASKKHAARFGIIGFLRLAATVSTSTCEILSATRVRILLRAGRQDATEAVT